MTQPNNSLLGSLEDWEQSVFLNASHFTVFRFHNRSSTVFQTFTEALNDASSDARALLYAVTSEGRSFCVPRAQWPKYEELWNNEP